MALFIVTLITTSCLLAQAERILVVLPAPSISHQVVFRPLTQELARRGHEVVVITADPAFPKGQTPENLTEIDVHDISYNRWKAGMHTVLARGSRQNLFDQVNEFLEMASDIFEMQIRTEEVQSIINDKTIRFDLLMVEACVRPSIALVHVFKSPLIVLSSFGGYPEHYDQVGAPARPPLLYPNIYRRKLFNLTFLDKLFELYTHYYIESIFHKHEDNFNILIKKLFGPDTPPLDELQKRVEMLFLNVHPIWDLNRPVPPNVVYMGGLHQKTPKKLPDDLKSYLDSSKHGVIYISFGTNVEPSQLPPETIQVFLNTFSALPYDILCKWDKDELPRRLNNVRIAKWLPQSDLLRHPNVKLFITQGGLQSTDEAITAGVPLIGMPMLGDQWYNVEQYMYHNIGLKLDMETLTEPKLNIAIETILKDDSYRNNVIKLRSIMRDQPQSPLERAVWWTEHIMRHGGAPHLRARAANMSWAEYLDIELIIVLAVCAFFALIAVGIAARLILSFVKNIKNNLSSSVKSKTN